MDTLPRIASAASIGWPSLAIGWRDGSASTVNVGGWIMTGGDILAPLREPRAFAEVACDASGAFLYWQDPDGDLAIDAAHLRLLHEEQKPFLPSELVDWQARVSLSNREAADFAGVALSTWNAMRAGGDVPVAIGSLCRAALRDPIVLQARYKPRRAGRPLGSGAPA